MGQIMHLPFVIDVVDDLSWYFGGQMFYFSNKILIKRKKTLDRKKKSVRNIKYTLIDLHTYIL